MDQGAWERVADVSARLFLTSGFDAVSLRQIGGALGMKPASLYYHCPDGKAQLYVRSVAHVMERLKGALEAAAETGFPAAGLAMADAVLGHPPVDFRRIISVDVPALARVDAGLAEQVPLLLHAGLYDPFREMLHAAQSAGQLSAGVDLDVLAAATLALIEGLGAMHGERGAPGSMSEALVHTALTLLWRGAAAA